MKTDISVPKFSWQSDRWLCLAVFAASLASRVPALLFPPSAFYYSLDEWELGMTALDRYLGVPPLILNKPGSVFFLASMPLVLVHWIASSGLPHGTAGALSSFSGYLSHIYCNPKPMLLYMRWLIAVVSCCGPVFLYLIVAYLTRRRVFAVGCALCLALQPIFYRESVMVAGEGWAVTFVLCGLWIVLWRRSSAGILIAGWVTAAGVASRITVLPFTLLSLLFVMGIDDEHWSVERGLRSGIMFVLGCLVGFLFWCPYVWVEPIRFLKNLLGSINKPGGKPDLNFFMLNWLEGMGYGFAFLFLLSLLFGAWFAFRHKHGTLIGALVVLIMVCLPVFLRSTTAYPRYFVAAVPTVLILLALLVKILGQAEQLWSTAFEVVIFIVAVAIGAQQLVSELNLRRGDDLVASLVVFRELPDDMVVYMPEEVLRTYEVDLTRQVQDRLKDRAQRKREDERPLLHFLQAAGIPPNVGEMLIGNFNEYEESQFRRIAASNCATPVHSPDVRLYYDPSNLSSFTAERLSLADMPLDQAVAEVGSRHNVGILVPYRESRLGQPFWSGGRWYWYRR